MSSQTCSDIDRVFVILTPSILRVVTRSMSAIGGGGETWRFFLLSLNIISCVFFRFAFLSVGLQYMGMIYAVLKIEAYEEPITFIT